MKVYLMKDGVWKLYENPEPKEFADRNIIIGAFASVGESAIIGAFARIGESASIEDQFDYILISLLGSRKSVMTAYKHKDGIMIGTGCWLGWIDDFEKEVNRVHGDNNHGKDYAIALEYVRKRLKDVK